MNATERFWHGDFGNDYVERNRKAEVGSVESNVVLFRQILKKIPRPIETIIELGAGVGYNLQALRQILPQVSLSAVEINKSAIDKLRVNVPSIMCIYEGSVTSPGMVIFQHDMAFTKGLLIHIPPEQLPAAYAALFHASKRYVLVCEYYCPTPRMIHYRGHDDRLWARDFAGEMMKAYPLDLIDCGFISKYDKHPQDDLTYFLMEKRK